MIKSVSKFLAHGGIFVSIVGIAILMGYAIEKIMSKKLKKVAEKTQWKGDEIIIKSFSGLVPILFGVIGFYLSLDIIALPQHFQIIFEKLLVIIGLVAISIILTRAILGFIEYHTQTIKEISSSTSLIKTIIKIIIVAVMSMIILQAVGISITPIITAFGIGGLAVALAFQDTLANLFAGFYITIAKQIKVGDFIELENGSQGYVIDIGWRSTSIRTVQNNVIILPNTKFANSVITNYCLGEQGFNVPIQLGVSFTDDLKKVEEITKDVARKTLMLIPGGVTEFEPQVRYISFGKTGVNFDVILRVKEYKYYALLKHEFIKQIHERYKAENIALVGPS